MASDLLWMRTMKRTLALAALSTLGLSSTAFADAAGLAAPRVCIGAEVRHRVMLPVNEARNVPLNGSVWAIENAEAASQPIDIYDTVTDTPILVEAVYYPTATGVVVQFKPRADLEPSRTYEVRNTHLASYRFTTRRSRDETAPRRPMLLDSWGQHHVCGNTYGVAVILDAEENTLTFAERRDGTLLGFAEPNDVLQVAGEVDTEVEFTAYTSDLAGNTSADTAVRRETVEDPPGTDNYLVGCTCVGAGRAGIAVGLLLLPLVLLGRRRK